MLMKFCPKCGGLLVQREKELICTCGYRETAECVSIKEIIKKKQVPKATGEVKDTMPTMEVKCPKCGHGLAYWWTRQTRAADEPETTFYRCTKCGYSWREY